MSQLINKKNLEVQPLSMQWLDLGRTRKYLSWDEKTLSNTSLGKVVKAIIEAYNTKHEDQSFAKKTCDFDKSQYKLKVYARPFSTTPSLVTDLGAKGVKNLKKRTGNEILLFFCPVAREKDIVILTSDQSWRVVRECVNHSYPVKVAEKILDPNGIVEIVRRCLIGPNLKETILHPPNGELLKTTSLYYLIESFRSSVKTHASMMNLPPFDNQNKEPTIKITAGGLLRIEKRLRLEDYPALFNLFYDYIHDELTYSCEGKPEDRDMQFEFLHFVQPAQISYEKLNTSLVEEIFKAFTDEKDLSASFRHKYLNDFYKSDNFAIQFKKGGCFVDLSLTPPTLQEILEAINENHEIADHKSLYAILCECKIRFNGKNNFQIEEFLIKCIESELRYKGRAYFKLHAMWYQITTDFNALLIDDFRTLLKQKLLKLDAEGQLPNPWKGNKPQDLLKEADVKVIVGSSGIRKFMKELSLATMCFVSPKGIVNQTELVGEILSVQVIKDNKQAIEEELASKDSKKLSERLKNRFPKGSEDILKELTKERKIVEVVKKGDKKETRVVNPAAYPLKLSQDKEKALQDLLTRLYDNRETQDEAAYNRTYLFDQMNKGKPFGDQQGYLVFDQVLPNNIEPCDVVYYTPTTTRLYHVKEDFGQHTRDAVSQILTSAKALRAALSTQQPQDFVDMLWIESMKTKKTEGWRALVKQQLEALGKKNFLKIFFERKIVFVYALLVKPGHSLHSEISRATSVSLNTLKSTPDSSQTLQKLEKNGYIDSRRRLTGKFYESTQDTFSLEEEDSQKVFAELKPLKPVSESTLAKLEVIHLARELQALNFELEICEIQRPDSDTSQPSQPPSIVYSEEESSLEEQSLETKEVTNGPSGLVNIGNSCYINATLQAIFYLQPIQTQIENQQGNRVVKSLSEVLANRDRKALQAFRSALFKEGVLKGNSYGQHDAHELLIQLFDSMKWLPFKTYTSVSCKIKGEQKSHQSQKTPTHHLSIGLSENQSLQEAISDYFDIEEIDDPNNYLDLVVNNKTHRLRKYSIGERIAELPEILVIHLKRFDNSRRKITHAVPFPEDETITIKQRPNDPVTTYKIVSIINHHGPSIHVGHYTADIKDLTTEDEPWIHYNDSNVTYSKPIKPETNAYIVFLQRCPEDSSESEEQ